MFNRKNLIIFAVIINIIVVCISTSVFAEGEGDTFTTNSPEVLFVLDISGSMRENPAGGGYVYGATSGNCTPDATNCNCGASSGNANYGYCNSTSKSTCKKNCTKLEILKRTFFNTLNADATAKCDPIDLLCLGGKHQTIDSSDDNALGIPIGYMRFWGCMADESSNDYFNGCIKIPNWILTNLFAQTIGTPYQQLYCGVGLDILFGCQVDDLNTSIAECMTNYFANWGSFLNASSGGTPISSALRKAKAYLDSRPAGNACAGLKEKFAILITDGEDTLSCSGNGSETQANQYKRRRASVYAAKVLKDAGYKLFVIGLGSGMPTYLQNTLNWMAYYGGTDNTIAADSGDVTSYTVQTTDENSNTGCGNEATGTINNCTTSSSGAPCYAASRDPGNTPLSGYAYISANEDDLLAAIKKVIGKIAQSVYDFTQTSIQTSRISDNTENYLYEASFQNMSSDPLWIGHLNRFSIINSTDPALDGTVASMADWDAGTVLQSTAAGNRNIYTIVDSSGLKAFNTTNVTTTLAGVSSTTARDNVVNFIRGGDVAYSSTDPNYAWKLGDIYHSSPQSIGTPNATFLDQLDTTNNAFNTFRNNNPRTSQSTNQKRIIVVGANDGQLHAFKTYDGSEAWSFIPPNKLPLLQNISHSAHATSESHQYFVDGPISGADIWLGSNGTAKSVNDWYTYLIMAEGRGGNFNAWSSSPTCSSGFNSTYTSTYNNYCGYYALDVTNTLSPIFKWKLGGTSSISSTDASYLGDPWSKMFIGRVMINNAEKWVGFIGGGYSGSTCTASSCADTTGKGFFAVDLSNGTILKSFTRGSSPTSYNGYYMNYDFAANPVVIDFDGDGYLDTAYIGDTGGNVWRFKFCPKNATTCNTSNWTGSLFFQNSTTYKQAIYKEVAVARGNGPDVWVYFGTGDVTTPKLSSSTDYLYALRDNDQSTTYSISNLQNITGSTYTNTSKDGWYITLASGEKSLGVPVVFNQKLFFTTYVAASCQSKIYGLNYSTGAGALSGNLTSEVIGSGISPGVLISHVAGSSKYYVYAATSINALTTDSHTQKLPDAILGNLQAISQRYWRDLRIQP